MKCTKQFWELLAGSLLLCALYTISTKAALGVELGIGRQKNCTIVTYGLGLAVDGLSGLLGTLGFCMNKTCTLNAILQKHTLQFLFSLCHFDTLPMQNKLLRRSEEKVNSTFSWTTLRTVWLLCFYYFL